MRFDPPSSSAAFFVIQQHPGTLWVMAKEKDAQGMSNDAFLHHPVYGAHSEWHPIDPDDGACNPFSGVWAVDGSDVVYVDANSSYLTYTQRGNHKVRRETVGYPHARHHPWLYIREHCEKLHHFCVGRQDHLLSGQVPAPGQPENRRSLIHLAACWGVVWNQNRIRIRSWREPHRWTVFILGATSFHQYVPK